jgi:cell division transport system permease protein
MNAPIQHWHVLLGAIGRMASTPVASLFNILVIGIALSLPLGVYVLIQNMQGEINQLAGPPQISAFLNLSASEADVARIGKQLKQMEAVERVEFVSKADALERLKRSSGLADVIGGLSQNPLPDAYIVHPKKLNAQALETLRDEIAKMPRLDRVQLDAAWAHRLEALLNLGQMAAGVLAALLGTALVAVTFNTIRLQILTRREEIEVAKLIGATNGFIRRPFLYFGLLQGLLGGIAAWAIVAAALSLLNASLAQLAQLYASQFTLHAPPLADSLALLFAASALGWLGAWLSVAQHLWRIDAAH